MHEAWAAEFGHREQLGGHLSSSQRSADDLHVSNMATEEKVTRLFVRGVGENEKEVVLEKLFTKN